MKDEPGAGYRERDEHFIRQVRELRRLDPRSVEPTTLQVLTDAEQVQALLRAGALWHPLVRAHLLTQGVHLVGYGRQGLRFRTEAGPRSEQSRRLVRALWVAGAPSKRIAAACAMRFQQFRVVQAHDPMCGPRRRSWTAEVRAHVRLLVAFGRTRSDVARMLRLDESGVRRITRDFPPDKCGKPRLPSETVSRIRALFHEGHTLLEIARLAGCSFGSARNYTRGLKRERPTSRP